jgi:hypothetical protein
LPKYNELVSPQMPMEILQHILFPSKSKIKKKKPQRRFPNMLSTFAVPNVTKFYSAVTVYNDGTLQ